VQIIVESGPDALTHRAIAERAGVSLSSTTHHFASLDDILVSAFNLIYGNIRQQPVVSTDLVQARRMETLLNILTEQALPGQRVAEREVMAMDEIMLAAARRPETQAIATGLLASVGRTSTTMLQTLEGKRDDTDRLDGQILRFIITGLQEQVAVSDDALSEAWFREHFERIATHFYC
jgi:DNA-binding transcriptional regulator YbjK